jgi:general secretion pathway protein D
VQPAGPQRADITLLFDQIPLPGFLQAVFGSILKRDFHVDPQVAARKDLVTLRTSKPQTPSQVEQTVRMVLKSYGVAVVDAGGGLLRIVPDKAQTGYEPDIRRGRALPETPASLRPVFWLYELSTVRSQDVTGWIKTIFGNRVSVLDDGSRNAVLVSGQADDVFSAVAAIEVLDQPAMRGRQSIRIVPVFWSADELTRKLIEILQAEGYATFAQLQPPAPVTLIPVSAVNSIIVFASDRAILDHVAKWARDLDRPSSGGVSGSGYFVYPVKYSSAQDLAKTMQELLTQQAAVAPAVTAPPAGTVGAALPVVPSVTVSRRLSRVVVNPATNSIIFQGNPEEYTQLITLLQDLDKPAKGVLIEVTVAEVMLDDSLKLGVEFAVGSGSVIGGTLGGLGVSASGPGLVIQGFNAAGDLRFVLQALATTDRANILSTPRVLARNGETAAIQVGSQLPTITSQQTSPVTGGTGSIIQTVQYVNTGVILKVKPVIHSGDRVDLEVVQEVSDSTRTGAAGSPIIDTRKVETKLSLRDGSTIALAGLMQTNTSRREDGIPLLKDIPYLGQLFRSNTNITRKTELIVLITPYIVADDHDAQAVSQALRDRFGGWAPPIPMGLGSDWPPGYLRPEPSPQQAPPPAPGRP